MVVVRQAPSSDKVFLVLSAGRLVVHFVFFVRVSMGSVSGDYKCPLCGRKGNGGYALDGLLCGPICTEGNYSCLRFQLCDQPYHRSAEDIVGTALYKLVKEKLPKEVCTNVVLFLKGELTAPPDPDVIYLC